MDDNDDLRGGFYRTDLLFGYGNRKTPLIVIVGTETQEKLKREKIKGMYLDAIN
jgi:hypothetical protein